MNDIQKEHLLHKILAGSALTFAFALLPIASYYFQSSPTEQGKVAGVSTTRPTVLGDTTIPSSTQSVASCLQDKQTQLNDLDRLQTTWQAAYAKNINQNTSEASIDTNTTKYQKEFAVVEAEREKVEAESC